MPDAYRKRNKRLQTMFGMTYQEYLQSPLWRSIRTTVLTRDAGACLLCRSKATEVHHTCYSCAALQGATSAHFSLCRRCHKYIEFYPDGRKTSMSQMRARMLELAQKHGTTQVLSDRGWTKQQQARTDPRLAKKRRRADRQISQERRRQNWYARR